MRKLLQTPTGRVVAAGAAFAIICVGLAAIFVHRYAPRELAMPMTGEDAPLMLGKRSSNPPSSGGSTARPPLGTVDEPARSIAKLHAGNGGVQTPPVRPAGPTTQAALARGGGVPPASGTAAPVASVVPLADARDALAAVGTDPAAEAVWMSAINDPRTPSAARKDLIEDLNEHGFPDPRNLTPNDLPLIISRLQIIEDLAPAAMDDVNAAAFAEAYKDLVKMYSKLTR